MSNYKWLPTYIAAAFFAGSLVYYSMMNEPRKPTIKPRKIGRCVDQFTTDLDNLDSLYETLPERRERSTKRMYDRMVHRLDSLDSIDNLQHGKER